MLHATRLCTLFATTTAYPRNSFPPPVSGIPVRGTLCEENLLARIMHALLRSVLTLYLSDPTLFYIDATYTTGSTFMIIVFPCAKGNEPIFNSGIGYTPTSLEGGFVLDLFFQRIALKRLPNK